jgi:hypothetical protein
MARQFDADRLWTHTAAGDPYDEKGGSVSARAEQLTQRLVRTQSHTRSWASAFLLAVWLLAGVSVFLPFAVGTSPWNALTLQVPGNQGNWWHVLVGFPFFLAFPMIWLRLRAFGSMQSSSKTERYLIWSAVGISACGTVLVEIPFLLHLAATSESQRLTIIALGLGVLVACSTFLFRRWRYLPPRRAYSIGLGAAYLANAALCLVVYASAPGSLSSRSGWLVTAVIVWPIAFDLIWPAGCQDWTQVG